MTKEIDNKAHELAKEVAKRQKNVLYAIKTVTFLMDKYGVVVDEEVRPTVTYRARLLENFGGYRLMLENGVTSADTTCIKILKVHRENRPWDMYFSVDFEENPKEAIVREYDSSETWLKDLKKIFKDRERIAKAHFRWEKREQEKRNKVSEQISELDDLEKKARKLGLIPKLPIDCGRDL